MPGVHLAKAKVHRRMPAASRRPGLSVQPLSDKDVTWLPRFFLSIVVQYIDGQPARIHEDFNNFALEALRANWRVR